MTEFPSKTELVQLKHASSQHRTHSVFAVTQEYASEATHLAKPTSKQFLGTHVPGIHRGLHHFKCQLLSHEGFLQPQTPETHMLRRNAVTTAPRMINDARQSGATMTVQQDPKSPNSLRSPSESTLAAIAENSPPSPKARHCVRCFFAKPRTPPPGMTTPPLADRPENLSEASQHPRHTRALQIWDRRRGIPAMPRETFSSIVQHVSLLASLQSWEQTGRVRITTTLH